MIRYKKTYLIILTILALGLATILVIIASSGVLSGHEKLSQKALKTFIHISASFLGVICLLIFFIQSVFFPIKHKSTTQYSDKEEQKRYEQRMVLDKPKIKKAIKNKNMNFLFMLANEYTELGYWAEKAELLTKIVALDPHGFYGKQSKKLLESDNARLKLEPDDVRLKNNKGLYLTVDEDKEIKKLKKNYLEDISSSKKALSLAEAYQRYGLIRYAILYYYIILANHRESAEANIAKIAVDKLIEAEPRLVIRKPLEELIKSLEKKS